MSSFFSILILRTRTLNLPGEVTEVTVRGAADDFTADLAELAGAVTEGDDLGRAHEREVGRVEEEDEVLALVVGQRDLLELAVHHGRTRPLRRRLRQS